MFYLRRVSALLVVSSVLGIVLGHVADNGVFSSNSGAEINVRLDHTHAGIVPNLRLEKRQACGAGVGSCPTGQCCSAAGQCGTGGGFCSGPDCQLAYGPACDGNIIPPGASTANIPRPKIGNLLYGQILYHCTAPNTIALTFDDGPWAYTQSILDTLSKYNAKATFFINGNNGGKGRIDDPSTPWPKTLKGMYDAGHQLASHTWSHQDLTLLPPNLRENQVVYNEMAFRNLFGFFPTYIRPPYGFCAGSSGCLDYLGTMGYHVIQFDIDTKDYMNDDPAKIQNSKNYFSGNVSNPAGGHSYMELSHDVHQQTAVTLVGFMLDTLIARGYKAVTVGECMGDPKANWYRDAGGIPSPVVVPAPVASTTSKLTSTSPAPVAFTAVAGSTRSSSPVISIITKSTSSTKSTTTTTSSSTTSHSSSSSTGTSAAAAATTTSAKSSGSALSISGWASKLLLLVSLCAGILV